MFVKLSIQIHDTEGYVERLVKVCTWNGKQSVKKSKESIWLIAIYNTTLKMVLFDNIKLLYFVGQH